MEEKRPAFDPLPPSSRSAYDALTEKNKNGTHNGGTMRNMRELLASTLFWIGFGLFGWYFPRSLVHRETSILSLEPPYQMAGGGTVIVDFELNQPLVDPPTVGNFLLRSTSIGLPLIFLVIHAWLSETPAINDAENAGDTNSSPNLNDPGATSTALRFRIQRVANVISAFSAAMGLSEGCTVMVKLWVQRRRPNFYALCGFDAANQKCMGTLEHIREANFSFPSGHSSLICCGMTFLVWYVHGAANTNGCLRTVLRRPFDNTHARGRRFAGLFSPSPRFCSLVVGTCLPWGWALFVAASRLVDHWHHPSDVLAGLALGFSACTIAYHHWYPPVWSPNAGIPLDLIPATNIKCNNDTGYSSKTNAGLHTTATGSSMITASTVSTSIGAASTTTKRRPNTEPSPSV